MMSDADAVLLGQMQIKRVDALAFGCQILRYCADNGIIYTDFLNSYSARMQIMRDAMEFLGKRGLLHAFYDRDGHKLD